jgi:hypothetical protein
MTAMRDQERERMGEKALENESVITDAQQAHPVSNHDTMLRILRGKRGRHPLELASVTSTSYLQRGRHSI